MTVEAVILTVVPREFQALHRILALPEEPNQISRTGTRYWLGGVSRGPRRPMMRIGLTCVGLAGNSEASAATTEALLLLRPRIAILVGIAAGLRGKVRIGEVVLGDRVLPYEKGELRRSRKRPFVPEGVALAARHDVIQALAGYSLDSARLDTEFAHGGGTFPRQVGPEDPSNVVETLTVQIATIASGEKLLKDPSVLRRLQETQGRKTRAGDMEAWGFAYAAERMGVAWLVSRGISDFGDRNKADVYQMFAAATAGTVAVDFLRTSWSLGTGKRRLSTRVVKATTPDREMLIRRSRRFWQAPFEIELRVRLSSGGGAIQPNESERLFEGGPVAIVGRAGSGKTQFLLRAAASSHSEDVRYFDLGGAMRRLGSDSGSHAAALLPAAQVAGPPTLENVTADTFLFVDGLDEIDPVTALGILASLWTAWSQHGARVMVADRQEGRDDRYQVARLQATRPPAGTISLPVSVPSIPLFIDLQLYLGGKGNEAVTGERSAMRSLLDTWIDSAFRGNRKDRALAAQLALTLRIRGAEHLQTSFGPEDRARVLLRLQEGGIGLPVRDHKGEEYGLEFHNLLVQDYLSSEALAALGSRSWCGPVFDEISRYRNSPDAIAFTLDRLNEDERIAFGARVFDWSYRTLASALILAVDEDAKSSALDSLAVVVGVKLAERASAVFVDSSSEAASTLRVLASRFPSLRRLGADLKNVLGALAGFHAKFALIEDWKNAVLQVDGNVSVEDLERLGASQPLLGWATATWLRGQTLNERIVANLEMLYHIHRNDRNHDITRWRIVHVLGAARGKAALEVLMLAAETDSYIWARHGAVRSIFETIAGLERQRRYATFRWLADLVPRLDLRILGRTIRRASLLRQPPTYWYEDLTVLAMAVERVLDAGEWVKWSEWFSILGRQHEKDASGL